jgi:hypothetical protein
MNTAVLSYVSGLNRRNFSNNQQRVLHTLLTTRNEGGWVKRSSIRVPSVSARLRDLRKERFGNLDIECVPAVELGQNGNQYAFSYRINTRNLTVSQLRRVFEGV